MVAFAGHIQGRQLTVIVPSDDFHTSIEEKWRIALSSLLNHPLVFLDRTPRTYKKRGDHHQSDGHRSYIESGQKTK